MSFNKIEKDIKIKFDILNMQELKHLRDYGCRILSLESQFTDQNGDLCIEGLNGELTTISPEALKEILKPAEGDLKISVVFINIEHGEAIGNVFKDLGVP